MIEAQIKTKMTDRLKFLSLGSLAIVLLFYGCDSLEKDVLPRSELTTGEALQVYTLPGASTNIDFRSLTTANQEVTVSVIRVPQKGDLKELEAGLMKYTPHQSFKSGVDQFVFTVTAGSTEAVSDTVEIVVGDTLDMPCTYIAVDDSTTTLKNTPVHIDVLANDWWCEKLDISFDNLKIISGPANGAVTKKDSLLVYTPDQGFEGFDDFVYKICATNDSICGIGEVKIAVVPDTCQINAMDDRYNYRDIYSTIPVFFDPLKNDILCGADSSAIELTIVESTSRGSLEIVKNNYLFYLPDSMPISEDYQDSFVYRVCVGGNCDEATAIIDVMRTDSCQLDAVDDFYVLRDSLITEPNFFPVLSNDALCNSSQSIVTILTEPLNALETSVIDNLILYRPDSTLSTALDSLQYQLCEGSTPCDSAWVRIEW